MIVSVHTGAFIAIYPSECYATTNFLDPDLGHNLVLFVDLPSGAT